MMKLDIRTYHLERTFICFISTLFFTLLSFFQILNAQIKVEQSVDGFDPIAVLLSEYVKLSSISGNEIEAGQFLSNECLKRGLYINRLTSDTSSYNFCASLYPLKSKKPNIIFLNHIDVVPAGNIEDWTYPPYSGAIVDGCVWGRGAIDNKGMAIMQLEALSQFVQKSREFELPFNVSLLSVSSEEVGGHKGAKIMVDSFLPLLNPVVVFGEGGSGIKGIISSNPQQVLYGISIASKRGLWLRLKLKMSTSGHGSVPSNVDANRIMIKALDRLNNNLRPIQLSSPTRKMFRKLGKLEGGIKGFALRNISLFKPFIKSTLRSEPIIYALVSNTATLTNVSNPPGAINKISEEVEATIDCRLLPETDTEDFIKYIKKVLGEDNIQIEVIIETQKALDSRPDGFYRMMKTSLEKVYPGSEVVPVLFPAFNDNNYFRAQNVQAFGILPIQMDHELLESIHSINERMPIALLKSGCEVYRNFVEQLFESAQSGKLFAQSIRGKIMDNSSQIPISDCIIVVSSDSSILGAATTNLLGQFSLDSIPIGRHLLKIFNPDYEEIEVRNIVLESGKETVLNIFLEESVNDSSIVFNRYKKDVLKNNMAFVSTRTFTSEETDRYAGSRGDPARMVANFAGVRGLDDTRNDIIVRGNSPANLLWQVEGVDIPNPNHFALFGSTGGGVNIINNDVIDNSKFISGSMPAEYGNAIAGVFDIKLRNGNSQNFETAGEIGVMGVELVSEGPIRKSGNSSFLIALRHSTFDLVNKINGKWGAETSELLGISAIPKYNDVSFKLNFPISNTENLSFFGVGGKSRINFRESNRDLCNFSFENHGQNVDFSTSIGVAGINYSKIVGKKLHAKISLFTSVKDMNSKRDLIIRDSISSNIIDQEAKYRNDFNNYDMGLKVTLNSKFNAHHSLMYGFTLKNDNFNLLDSLDGIKTTDYQGDAFSAHVFAKWKYKLNNNLIFQSGFHTMYYGLNNKASLEPRISAIWFFKRTQSISFAAGLHTITQPSYIYFQVEDDNSGLSTRHNEDIGFTYSQQYAISYNNTLSDNIRLRIEGYYQRLYNVPVEIRPSSFSMLNEGLDFKYSYPGPLDNSGEGENYGIDITLERYYNKGYFYLLTGSLYNSTYEGSDLIRRNTDYNGNFTINFLIGKEITFGRKSNRVLRIGLKTIYAGGRNYTPIDLQSSIANHEKVVIDSLAYSKQFSNYFRTDLKLTLKINKQSITHEIGLDLLNIIPITLNGTVDDRPEKCKSSFNISTLNVLSLTYDPTTQSIRREYQLGFLPLLYYKLKF